MKIVRQEIDCCEDCFFSNIYSVDCVTHAFCNKVGDFLPVNGTESPYKSFDIPIWCPLEDATTKLYSA